MVYDMEDYLKSIVRDFTQLCSDLLKKDFALKPNVATLPGLAEALDLSTSKAIS